MGFLSFMTFICFTVTLLQANSTDFVNEALLTKLLDLHQYHCGDAATCGSSEHVEPSEFLIPVPCCIPCSCLLSCAEQQNCCPFPVNGTLTVPTTKSRMDTIVHENEAKMPNNGLGSVRKDMKTWNRTGENKAELDMGDFGIENITEFSSRDSEAQKMIGIDSAKEKCTRPQAFYRPNIYLDSPAYMMVVTCPGGFKDKLIIAKCSAGMNGVELLDMIPVTSKLSGLTYQNKYCLICNEKLQRDNFIVWSAEIVYNGARRELSFFPNPDSILNHFKGRKTAFRNVHFIPGDESLARPCKAYDIISCNQTGLWEIYNKMMESLCIQGYQLPIISKINNHPFTFKNIGCLYCNTRSDLSEYRLSCGYWERQLGSEYSFSLSLNLRSIVPDDQNNKTVVPAPYIEHDVLQQLQDRQCPAGKLRVLGRCRGIICPRDHYILDNQCVPLYDTMTGLDLNIQIQITPSQTIPSDISDTFVGNLKQMADKALSNAVRLQRRQVSLWYLPRSKANPTEYYLLNIFLFSPSNVINYSAAVDQIKRFFLKMKTGVKLAILETTNIKLNFQFKHGLELRLNRCTDMSNGQTLKPLMEKGWTLINPGPHMTISELNWCFRTVFDLSDIEPYRLYILLKSTNDVVFIDQFDRDGDQFYLCLDLFIELKRVKEDFQITQEGTPSSDDDKDMSREIVADPERGLIVTGSLIAVILLLVILYKVKHVMAKKQFEESSRSNQPPSDFVELNVIRNINTTDHMRLNGILDDEKHINIVGQDNEASVNIKTEQN